MSVFTLTNAIDNFTGSAGENNTVFFTTSTLQPTDTITGGATGSFFDILTLTAGGTIVAGQFAGVTNFEVLNLSNAGNSVSLTNGLVAGADKNGDHIFSVVGGSGDDTVDASGVTNSMRLAFIAGAGNDHFIGGNGNDTVVFATTDLTSADVVSGGNGFDFLAFSTGGTITAAALASITSIEEVLLSNAGNTITLSNGFVSGADNGVMSIVDGTGNDTVDASGITNAIRVAYFTNSGNDTFIGGNGSDYVSFHADQLTSADHVTGGSNYDIIEFDTAGTVAAGAFTNVTGIDELILNAGGNNVTLTNAMVAGSDNGVLVVLDNGALPGGTGNDVLNASAVASNRIVFQSNGGNDSFTGGGGSDVALFTAAGLTSGDTFAGGAGFDVLQLTTAGTVGASAFTNFTGVDELFLTLSGNNITLNGGVVANSDNGVFVVFDQAGNNTVDASAATLGGRVVFNAVAGDHDTYTGGTGSDFFQFGDANLNNTDTLVGGGGAGTDFLQVTTAASVTAADLANVSQMEVVQLLAGGSIALGNSVGNAGGSLEVDGTSAVDSIDGSAVTGYNLVIKGSGGADTLKGGSGNDQVFLPDTNFAAIDGNGGFDKIVLTAAFDGQTFDLTSQASKIAHVEAITLEGAANAILNIAPGDISQVNSTTNLLYVVAGSDDQVNVSGTGWSVVATGQTNPNLPGHTFVHYHHTNGSDLYIDETAGNVSIASDQLAAVIDSGTAVEDVVVAPTGNLIANDQYTGDPSLLHISAVAGATDGGTTFTNDGTFGRLVVTKATGTYTYTLGVTAAQQDAVQHLATGAQPTETFNYTVTDGSIAASANLIVTVFGTNDAPTATAAVVPNATEDTAYSFNVSTLFTDVDSNPSADTLTYQVAGLPAGLSLAGSTISGTPTNDDVGSYTISVTANDGHSGSLTRTFSFSVANTNDAPVGNAASYTINEDTPLSGAVSATDVDGNSLSYALVGGSAVNGSATVNPGGTFTFTPTANFSGDASFQFTANDGTTNSAPQTVTIHVSAVNDAPGIVNPATVSPTEDTQFAFDNANTVSVSDVDFGATTDFSVAVNVQHGSLQLIAQGGVVLLGTDASAARTITGSLADVNATLATLKYTAAPNFNGLDTLTITANDAGHTGSGGTQMTTHTVTLSVGAVNDAPVGNADVITINEDQQPTLNVLGNDTDADGPFPLSISRIDGNLITIGTSVGVTGGTATVNANGTISFAPTANLNGAAAASFTYTVKDGNGQEAAGPTSVTLNITAVNDAPIATADKFTVNENGASAIGNVITGNNGNGIDSDIETTLANLTVTGIRFPGDASFTTVPNGGSTTLTFTNGAQVTVDSAGNVTFAQNGAFESLGTGQQDELSFQYRLADTGDPAGGGTGLGAPTTANANVRIVIDGANDAPVANADTYTTSEDTPMVLAVLGNDTDVDGPTPLAVARINGNTVSVGNDVSVTGGSVHVNADGTLTFTPTANSTADGTFTYKTKDASGTESASAANVTVHVTAVNDAPVAHADTTFTTPEDQGIILDILANDTDVEDGIPPQIASVNGTALTVGQTVGVIGGTVTLNAAGAVFDPVTSTMVTYTHQTLTFTPTPNSNVDAAFVYTAKDSNGTESAQASVAVDVTPVNDAPVASPDSFTTLEDTPVTFDVRANDTDVDNSTLVVTHINGTPFTGPGNTITLGDGATVHKNGNGTLTYTPAHDVNGPPASPPSFTYTVSDGLASSTSTVNINITPVNDAPVNTAPSAVTATEDTPFNFTGGNQLSVVDVDSNVTVTLSVDHGVLNVTGAGVTGNGTNTVTIASASPATMNTTLSTLTYLGDSNFNGNDTLTMVTSDGSLSDTDTVAISVTAVADVSLYDSSNNLIATFDDLETAVLYAQNGQHIRMAAGNIALEGPGPHDGKVIVDKDITIEGAGKLATTLLASTSIANAQLSSSAAMIVVATGHTVDFSNFTVNGNDRGGGDVDVSTGILFDGGNGSATNMRFTNIGADVGDEPRGTGVVAWNGAQVTVSNSDFDQNERRGLAAFDTGTHVTISGSTFTAKTAQDEVGTFPGTVDYGVQASDGALVDISGSTFTNFSASENGFGSAGLLVAPVLGGTSTVNLNGNANTFTNNSVAIAVGFNATDTDVVHLNGTVTVNSTVSGALGLQAFGDVVVTDVPANLSGGVVTVDWQGGPNGNAIFGDDQNDTLQGNGGNDTISAGGGDDAITYNAGDGSDTVDGGSNTATGDTLTINGTAATETFAITGGSPSPSHIDVDVNGSQAIDVTDVEEIVVNTNGGGDTVNISGSFGGTTLHTNSITVNGGAGNDTVNASGLTSAHSIHFTGGGGDDTFVSSNAGGNDFFDGGTDGANGDTVDYSAVTGGGVSADLAHQEAHDIGGTGVGSDDLLQVENVVGTAQNDTIRGDGDANTLSGGGGDDALEGRGGNDTIYGGTSVGDSGHDTAVFTGIRADYTVTRIGSGVYTVADSVGGRDATDTVHDIETLHFNGDASDLLLDAPIQVFDATDTILLATFQANQLDQAVSYANTHAGANVIELNAAQGPFTAGTWPVDITEAVTIKAVGGTATVNAGGNSAFTIEASAVLGAADTVRLEGLNITGNGTTGDTVGVFFNGTYEGPSDGAIQLVATSVSGFGSDGVAIIGGGAGLTVTVDGDNPNLAGIQTATLTGSGYSSTSGGSGDVLFFAFTGAAALKNINVVGTTGTAASSADNGIQFAGFDGADHSVDHAIGSVSFQNVSVSGTYEKTLVYVQGYDNLSGLNFTNGLTLGGAGSATTWTGLFIDGGPQGGAYVTDGTSTLDLTGVVVNGGTYGTSPSFAALGSKPIVVNGVVTGDVITGTAAAEAFIGSTGDDTINAGGGADLVLYNVGDGHDTVDGQGGTDTLGLINLSAGVPSATPASFAVSQSGGHLIVQTDGTGPAEVDAAGMESVQFVLGNGGDTVTLTGNIAGAGIATGPGGIIVTGGTGGDTLDASGLTSANAITFSSLGGGNDTFKAANVVANDTVDGAGGTGDSLDYSAASAAVSIDLAAGTASGTSVGSDTVLNYENATGGAGGDTISGTSGANTLSGNGGDDTLTGRGGADTLVGGETGETHGDVAAYAQVITAGMIATNGSGGWTVTTAGAEGTDTLSEMEVVQGADPVGPGTGKFLLVGNGGYATIAAAYAEAADGDTIVLAPGTYAGDFTVGKAISIVGANYSVDGAVTRGAESVLTGHWTVNAAGPVTIDGVEFLNNTPYTSGSDDTRLTIATDATVAHSLFYNTRPGGNKPISDIAVNVTATTGSVSITDNRFTGDFHGKYFNGNLTAGSADSASWGGGSNAGGDAGAIVWHGGSTLAIDGNTIEFARTALTLLNGNDTLLTINDNDFVTNGTSVTATGWQGSVTSVTNNAFTDVDNEFNLRSNTTGVDINFGATGNTSDNWFSVLGTTGVDTITGTAGKDAILAEQGDDTVHTGAGNDSIFFNTGSGNDTVDGGSESAGKDTLIVSNTASANNTLDPGDAGDPATSNSGSPSGTAVTFNMTVTAGNPVVPTDGTDSAHDISVVAQTTVGATPLGSVTADEIEDVQFNLGNGGDTVNMSGDFSTTSLSASTITVNGGNGADTVDARNLSSAHAIHFNGNGGDDYFYVSGAGGNDTFDGGTGTNTIDYSDVGHGVTVNLGNSAAQNTGDGSDTISNVQNVVGTGFDDTLTGTAGANRITGGAGIDTSSYSGTASTAATFGFDGSGHWTVTIGSVTDTLIGVEKLVFSDKTILLVDHAGANVGGFQTVQSAIDYASGGETILIKGGTYTESGNPTSQPGNFGGLYIDKPNLTLQGVKADGSFITTGADAQTFGPTIVAGHQNNFGANHWIDVDGTNTTIQGLHLAAGAETNNKLVEFWADGVTIKHNYIDTLVAGVSTAAAIYINEITTGPDATPIDTYTIDGNILVDGIYVANGVGTPGAGISSTQQITGNTFTGTFTQTRFDMVAVQGEIPGVPWQPDAAQVPTISGNTRSDNSAPFIFRMTEKTAALFPSGAEIAQIVADNTNATSTYAYVLDGTGQPELIDRNDGSGLYHQYGVANSISTLNLALDTTPDAVFGGQRDIMVSGDTIVVQSVGTTNENIDVDGLIVKASATSADLNLTLGTNFPDNSPIPGGVHNLTLADYAAGQGANVDVTGNTLDNVIVGNSGNNTLAGAGGDDTLHGGGGNDALQGGVGLVDSGTADKATYDDARANYTIATTSTDGFVTAVTDVTETTVVGTNEGHDTLSGIEVLQFSGLTLDLTQNVQLFDSTGKLIGTFDHIQDAVNAAAGNAGINETIRLRDGVTYTEQVTIDGGAGTLTGLTIIGANVDGNPSTGATIKAPMVLGINGFSDHFHGGVDVRANIAVKDVTGVTISNVTVDGNYAGDTTPGSNGDEIAGIAYLHASGTIDGVHVEHTSNSVGGGLFGLQHGSGIFSDNGIGAQQSLTITNSTVDTFQKTGVLLWNVNVDMRDNTVTGVGPSALIAQNAMQIGGSQGTIGAAGHGNTFQGVGYTLPGTTSTDLIVYEPSGSLTIAANTLTGAGGAGQTVGLDLTDVDPAVTVTVTNNAFGATGFGLVDGIDAYTFDGTIGLGSDPVMSGNTFTDITGNGIFLDPEFVATGPAFSTNTAFTETGTQFADVLHGSDGADNFSGGAGNDDLMGRLGIDTINGGAGNDMIAWRAGDGNDSIDGGNNGTPHDDTDTLNVAANGHNLTLTAGSGNFTVSQDDSPATNTATVSEVEEVDITLSGGETITINGDFTGTGIAQHTITIDGSAGSAGETVNTVTLGSAYPVDIKFTGGTGSDTLVVGNGTHLDFDGGGNATGTGDTIDFSHVTTGIVIDSTGHVSGGATGSATNIENIIGTSATDRVEFSAGYTVTLNNDGSATVSNGTVTEHLSGIEQIKVGGTTYDLTQQVRLFDSGNHLIGTFDHIQQGVGAAHASGDTVKVAAGHYQEQVTVDAKSVTITGAGEGSTFIDSPDGNTLVANVLDAASSRQDKYALVGAKNGASLVLSGITIDGRDQGTIPQDTDGLYDFVGIQGVNASINADHVTVTGIREVDIHGDPSGVQHNTAIIVDNTDAAARSFTLTNSTVTNFQKNGLALLGTGLTVNVDHNTVTGAGAITTTAQNGIQVSGGAGGSVTHNTLSGIDYVGPANAIASNILVFGAASGVVVSSNAITGAAGDGDAGIYFFNSDAGVAHGNTLNGLAYGLVDDGTFTTPVDHLTAGVDDNTFNPTDANGIAIGFYGNTATNYTFAGSTSTDDLEGGTGNDNLDGRGGNDFLVGNAGADTLTGGSNGAAGDTVAYVFEAGGVAVTVNLSNSTFGTVAAGHATDTFGATDTLSGIENVSANVGRYGDTVALDGAFAAWTVSYDASTHAWTATKGAESHLFSGIERLVFQNGGSPQTVHLVDPAHAGSAYLSAQDAINHAAAGDTILLAAGTYNENLTTDKALTILGANHGVAGAGMRSSESVINWTTGNAVTVDTMAQVTFDGLKFTGTHVLVETNPNANIGFSDSVFTLTSAGGANNNFYLNQPDSFSFTNNKLDATGYTGALFQPVGTVGDPSHTSVTFTGNTFTGHPATYVAGDDNNVPLIINLSDVHGTVSNNTFDHVDIGVLVANGTGPLDITGNTFENMHRDVGTSGGGFAAGVVFFQPAPFGGLINVSDNTFSDTDAGIRTSAVPGTTVAGSTITIDDNHFTSVDHIGFQPVGGVLHFTDSTVNGPTVPSEFFGGTSNDTITSTAANDIVHGNDGIDTLVLSGNQSDYTIAFDGTTVTVTDNRSGHPDGVDIADHIGKLHFADHNVLLVGAGSDYTTVQSAVTAASASDTVLLAAQTFAENVAIDKSLTILGANHGVMGDASRGAESIIDGGFRLTASDVTLDGLNVINGRDDFGQQRAAVFIDGARANITVENSILDETTASHPELTQAAILSTYNADTPNLQLLHNVIENWDEGMYLNPGVHDSTFDGNTFTANGNHIISDGIDDFTITNNNFGISDGSKIFVNVYANPTDLEAELGLSGNTFAPDHARLSVAPYGPTGQVVLGTSGNDNLRGDFGITVGVSFDGRAGNDLLVGTSGNDALTGNTGDDTLVGGAGSDTAQYTAAIAATDIATTAADSNPVLAGTQPGWTVNAGAEGTDTLSEIEVVDGNGAGRFLLVGNGGYASIAAALTAAITGDTILIAPGTYNENVVVNTSGITIKGAAAGVVIHGTFKSDNGISDGGVATFLKSGAGYTQVAGSGVTINADNVSIANLQIDGFTYGVNLSDNVDFASVSNVAFTDNLVGVKKGTTADITNFSLTGGSITDGLIGIDFDKDVTDTTPAHKLNGLADGVTVDGVSFAHLVYKGIYVEALSNAHLTNINMSDVGQYGAPSTSGTAGSGGDGIDLNLKNGDYSNVEIDHFTLTNVGASDRDGADAIGHKNGGAIVLESRDMGSPYSTVPATFTGTINVHDGTISGHTSTGIQVGEPGQNNADPDVTVTNVSITGEEQSALPNGHGDVANVTQSVMIVNMLDGGDSLIASLTTTGTLVVNGGNGADTITTGDGADTINGGAGSDTVNAGAGNDTVIGTADGVNDNYSGGAGTDLLDYSALTQTVSVNLMTGFASGAEIGTDTLSTFENVNGGGGDDSLIGSTGNNVIHGNGGTDNLVGDGGNDQLFGDAGNDTLNGGVNDFSVTPAAANDVLWGGAGTDTFRFEGRFGDDSIGTVGNADWSDGEDMVFVGYASHTPIIADVTDGVLITIDDGSVTSSVFVAGATSAQMQQVVSGPDLLIH